MAQHHEQTIAELEKALEHIGRMEAQRQLGQEHREQPKPQALKA